MKRQHNEVFRMSKCRAHCDGDRIHSVWERTCAASSAAFSLACQTRTNGRTAQPGEGRPPPRFLGSENVGKIPSRLWVRRTRIAIWSVRWGRSAGARCETRRRRASAVCVRREGCKTYICSPPQPATLGATARVSTSSRVRPCGHMPLPTAHCPPDHLGGLSEGRLS